LANKNPKAKVPVLAVCEDYAASGGYMIACAADEIYVNEYSIVGSIGVIFGEYLTPQMNLISFNTILQDRFGFNEAMRKLGIDRRIIKAGKYKVVIE